MILAARSCRSVCLALTVACTPTTSPNRADALTASDGAQLCASTSWVGRFIGPRPGWSPTHGPQLRRRIAIATVPTTAPIRVVGLGDYQLDVNGTRVTQSVSNQPWSQYDRRIYWREYDLGPYLQAGDNEIRVVLGASWWHVGDVAPGTWTKADAKPRFDPTRPFMLGVASDVLDIATDERWEWSASPLAFTHVLGGELVDASLDTPVWLTAEVSCPPVTTYERYDGPLLALHEIRDAVAVIARETGYTYSFARNMAAVLRVEVEGARHEAITFVPSEYVTPAGDVEQRNLHGARAVYEYVLRGSGRERYDAQFFYHGFQHVRVEGAVPAGAPNPLGLPIVHNLQAIEVRTALREVGSFTSSSTLYNSVHALVDASFAANASWVLSDCPHREKLGWLEVAYLMASSQAYRRDLSSWYRKIAQDIIDAQMPDGIVRNLAPYYLDLGADNAFGFTMEWGAAAVLLPWEHYRLYGDRAALERSYASMRAFVEAIALRALDHIAPGGLGDWYDYDHGFGPGVSRWTPPQLTATATYALAVRALLRAATVLDRTDDVDRYTQLLSRIQTAFWGRFYDPVTGGLRHLGSPQTSHAIALEADLVPAEHRAPLLDAIVGDLQMRGWQQTTGEIGHVYLIRALARAGRSDVLHRIYNRTATGSYGAMVAAGLTTLPERWDGSAADSASLAHAMLGHVMEWFYGYVAGIRQGPDSIAWSDIVIGPNPGDLTSAQAALDTPRGPVSVQWTVDRRDLTITTTIPPGPPARLVLPGGSERPLAPGTAVTVVRYR